VHFTCEPRVLMQCAGVGFGLGRLAFTGCVYTDKFLCWVRHGGEPHCQFGDELQ
jgi:hypothetical protein